MKRIVIILLMTVSVAKLYGQYESVKDSAEINLTKQLIVFPQEKIYLHTDKPYYITGEKIFFRTFLLDAFSNLASVLSRYVYVELINPADSVVSRIKIKPDENYLFHGAITIPEDLPQGNYKIRAYTQYMYNQGESSFFNKYVKISDPQILMIQSESNFQFTEDGKINISLRFINSKTQEIIHPQQVILRINRDRQFTEKPDKDGLIQVKLNLSTKATTRALYVEMTDNNRVYKQYLKIPYPESDFDVTFYPEGGHIIAGQASNIAFKAVNSCGAAVNVSGNVVDYEGNIVAVIRTVHDGMGDFFINPKPGEHYQAICQYGDRTIKFDLPEVKMNAYALKTINKDNKLWITVNKYDLASKPEFYLLIHSGGLIFYAKAWDFSKDFITFDNSVFPSGISHIMLLTKDLQTVSERLIFQLNDDNGIAEFQTQKDSYRKREKIQAGIQLKDGAQQALKGNFSIAITSDKEVVADTTSGILSGILLRSELRGYIDNPEYYFQKGNKAAESAADLLMKTHGWTRYAIPDVIRGELSYPTIPFEVSQEFSGIVKSGLFSRPAKNFNVSLISLDVGFFDMAVTDENGRYSFVTFEFPDSTKYIMQALNSKGTGRQMTELIINEDTFPGIRETWIDNIIQEENSNLLLFDYVAKADLQYTYENGIRLINLPEVTITARYEEKSKYSSVYYSSPDYSISGEEIEKYSGSDITNLLYSVPGVMVSGNGISIRGGGDPLVVIDDVPYMPMEGETAKDILSMISIYEIGQLDVLKNVGNTAVFGIRGSNGVIVVHTKRGEINSPLPSYNIKQISPLGYQTPVEFYSPRYDSRESIENSRPDLRTTIYWKPNAITNDKGNIKLDFYTADDPATYSVIIEGVSNDGRLVHYRGNAVIKVE